MPLLSTPDVQTYQQDGVVILRGVLPPSDVAVIEQGVEKNLQQPSQWSNDYTPAESGGRFFDDYVNWPSIEEFKSTALSGVLPRIAGELMNTTTPAPPPPHHGITTIPITAWKVSTM